MKKFLVFLSIIGLISGFAGMAGATTLDVWEWNSSTNSGSIIGQIDTIATAQTGAVHYSYSSASAHPDYVNLEYYSSSFWVHENTVTDELTFGLVFGIDNGPNNPNETELFFRIVDSTSDVYVSQSDDLGEAQELSEPGWFHGDYWYNLNTDGVAVSGITGTDWTIMIDSVDFGDITAWYAAGGYTGGVDLSDLTLSIGNEYRIVMAGGDPSDAPVNPTIPEPATMILLGSGLIGLAGFRRKMKNRRQ